VSERRRAEEALVQSQKLESLGLLAGGIAHDFNNLLTAMLCNVNLAQGSLGRADVTSYLDSIEASIRQAATLTRQVLAYAGKGHLVMMALDLSSVVRDVVRAMGVTVARTATLDVDLADGLPLVEADAAQIQQVVLNLLTNAADSMTKEGGSIRISTRLVAVNEDDIQQMVPTVRVRPGPHVLLQVVDTGCGMSAETQKRIFDPFFTTKPKGHGLGLSALMGILRGHRAGIHLESEVERGTLFRLYFPVAERHDRRDRSSLPPARTLGRSRTCVLVVDDDATIRDVLRPMLSTAGYTVLEAKDGEEGLEMYRERNTDIDVVLMDVTMPRKDGRDACIAMRQLRPDARIILMSGYAHHLDSKVLAATGATAFLPKPFEMNELLRTVRAAATNTAAAAR
jgi:CheY-like chemotaxis protein/nitrogen-specific signal transduction histidine kinase